MACINRAVEERMFRGPVFMYLFYQSYFKVILFSYLNTIRR